MKRITVVVTEDGARAEAGRTTMPIDKEWAARAAMAEALVGKTFDPVSNDPLKVRFIAMGTGLVARVEDPNSLPEFYAVQLRKMRT